MYFQNILKMNENNSETFVEGKGVQNEADRSGFLAILHLNFIDSHNAQHFLAEVNSFRKAISGRNKFVNPITRGEDIVISAGINKIPAQVVHTVRNVCFAVCEETSYFTLAPGPVVNGQQEINFQADQGRAVHKTWTEPPPDDGDASKTAGDVTKYTLMAVGLNSRTRLRVSRPLVETIPLK